MSNRTNLRIAAAAVTLALSGLIAPAAHAGTPGGPTIPNPPGTGVQCFQAPCPGVTSGGSTATTVETVANPARNAVKRPARFRHHR